MPRSWPGAGACGLLIVAIDRRGTQIRPLLEHSEEAAVVETKTGDLDAAFYAAIGPAITTGNAAPCRHARAAGPMGLAPRSRTGHPDRHCPGRAARRHSARRSRPWPVNRRLVQPCLADRPADRGGRSSVPSAPLRSDRRGRRSVISLPRKGGAPSSRRHRDSAQDPAYFCLPYSAAAGHAERPTGQQPSCPAACFLRCPASVPFVQLLTRMGLGRYEHFERAEPLSNAASRMSHCLRTSG